jgi:hypothetical protein
MSSGGAHSIFVAAVLAVQLGGLSVRPARAQPAPGSSSEPVAESASGPAAESDSRESVTASITYVTSSSVYVDAGTADGLQIGDTIEVLREDEVIATLRVEHLSSRKASCAIVDSSGEPAIGDSVRFTVSAADGPAGVVTEPGAGEGSTPAALGPPRSFAARQESWLRQMGIRGRIGARFLAVQDRSGVGQSFHQPAADLRVEGRNIGEGPFDLSIDVRARHTYRTASDGATSDDGRSRVYRLFGAWHPGPFHVSVGRQYSPDLPTISVFDGATAALRLRRVSFGLLSGTQPDPLDYGYSTEIREHAAFVRVGSRPDAPARWSLASGLIGSYVSGEINREFVYLQGNYAVQRLAVYVSQDIDLNRGWKKEAEGSSHSFTNTYANLYVRPAASFTLFGGYDNRRNIRLYRDQESPETEFDDAYRQGYWGGITQRFARRYRVGLSAKRSTGGSAGDADSYTVTIGAQLPVQVNLRSTRFVNEMTRGWMYSGRAGRQFGSRLHAEIGGGLRTQANASELAPDETLTWIDIGLDYSLDRHWYLSVSVERSMEPEDSNDQVYATTSYRF